MARPAAIEQDGIFGSIAGPRAIRHVGLQHRTYYCWVNSAGDIMVGAFDHDAKTTSTFVLLAAFSADTHAQPAMRITAAGKIQVFWSAHNGGEVHHRTSTNAEDISAWDADQTETFGFGLGPEFTYPAVRDLSARVVLHYREGTSASGRLHYTESSDDGATWSNSQNLVDDAGAIYTRTAKHPSSNRIDYFVTDGNPEHETFRISLYHFYRLDDDFYASDGTQISAGTASLPFTVSDLTQVWDGPTQGRDGWVWDIAHDSGDAPIVLFATMTSATGHDMRYGRWNGSSWDVAKIDDVGDSLDATVPRSAGGVLDPDDDSHVYLAVEADGIAEIREYSTADSGATWDAGVAITDDFYLNIRPIVPVNRSGGLPVLWTRGTTPGPTVFDMSIIGYRGDPPTGAGILTKTTDGEIFTAVANSTDNLFAIGDWEAGGGVATLAVQADDGGLRHAGSAATTWHYVRCSASISRGTRMVQALQRAESGDNWLRAGGHMEAGASGDNIAGSQFSVARSPDRHVASASIGTDVSSHEQSSTGAAADVAAKVANRHYRTTALLDGFDLTSYDFAAADLESFTNTLHSSGFAGLGGHSANNNRCAEFFDCTHWNLTATGLSTGDKLQLRNVLGVVLAEAAESAGTATIDMTEVAIPEVNDLVVVDSGGALLGGDTLAGAGGPIEYARGGDGFTFTPAAIATMKLYVRPTKLEPLFVRPPTVDALGTQAQ